MPQHRAERFIPHRPETMFNIVADIASYPQFVPHCTAMHIQSRNTDAKGVETVLATMTVRYKIFEERFTSRVTLDRTNLHIETALVSGPFKTLQNVWRFEPEGEGTHIHFFLNYEFRSRLLEMTMGQLFHHVFANFELAFEKRAEALATRT